MNAFKADIEEIRERARSHMEDGSITEAYTADRAKVIEVLNTVLATEIVCTLRYKNHYFMAQGIHSEAVADEFLEHANEEQQHADLVAKRITELGGVPHFDPAGIGDALARRVQGVQDARRHDPRGPGRRAHRGLDLLRDHSLARHRRRHDAPADGAAPRERGGARR